MAKKTHKSEALGAIHEIVSDLHDAGVLNKWTLHEFDEICLTEVQAMSPQEISALRKREHVGQTVFALHLNFSMGLIS